MTITVLVKSIYGNETIYPDCERSIIFAQMLGQKTLTRSDLKSIKALGFTVNVSVRPVSL